MAEDQTTLFRKSWGIYDALAAENYMHHRELTAIVATQLREVSDSGPWSLLDLGCGNARFLAPALPALLPSRYLGVDLSSAAMREARETYLSGLDRAEFLEADMSEALRVQSGPWEVVYSSFAIHHLQLEAKRELLGLVAAALAPKGRFLWVDVFRRKGEDRETYLEGYLQTMREKWCRVSPADLDAACAHVAEFDFPEPLDDMMALAAQAGFRRAEVLAAFGQHHALLLSEPAQH